MFVRKNITLSRSAAFTWDTTYHVCLLLYIPSVTDFALCTAPLVPSFSFSEFSWQIIFAIHITISKMFMTGDYLIDTNARSHGRIT